MIVANPICSVYPEERRVYPAGTELGRSDRSASARSWARSVILSAAQDPGLIASASVSGTRASLLCVKVLLCLALRILAGFLVLCDAASSLKSFISNAYKKHRGWGHPQAVGKELGSHSLSPSTLRIQLSTCFSPNRFSIRTCEKFARNPSTMNSSKTQGT